jgi:hypothetical protein
MEGTRLGAAEFKTLVKRTNEADYKPLNINYQVGNLETKRYGGMQKAGVQDPKIMSLDSQLYHGTGQKNAKQKIPEDRFDDLYKTFNEPENIYEEIVKGKLYRVFHFVSKDKDGKVIKVLLHTKNLKQNQTSLQVRTLGNSTYEYTDTQKYKKIW